MADAARTLADVDVVFAALAHPARRQILLTIHYWGGSMTAGDVANRFEHSWPTTTRHLQVLEDAGLLTHKRVGRSRRYTIVNRRLDVLRTWLGHFDASSVASTQSAARKTQARSA